MNDSQFVPSTGLHAVEVAEGSRDAKSKSATSAPDVRRVDTNSNEFIHAAPSAGLQAIFFGQQGSVEAHAPQGLDPAEVHVPHLSSTSAGPVIAAAATLDEPEKNASSAVAQLKSHFSDQIRELKEKNDHVRAELKRRESAAFTKT